ncbi:(2Fe-2S) ferredoxin [Kordiimonas sediminis]|uniref:(2Fe-2S) ferredoxin n=1 Tax=Kordiimonas sediminis TaxID=1735581 RepID=A0A919E488_9PROT|nr:aromatic ring-hydroxylating dioxygenase subunit alpha [Kordiimonas sediminis]GHF12105.1 (2Fe-2S) ferredoxin [Kordiimonas sediminis]
MHDVLKYESLPAWTYTSQHFFELEAEELFRKNWQLVCHTSDIPNAGDYFTFDFVGEHVFVIRDDKGSISGYHNVCRHRAARLLDGPSGNTKGRITCPYHAWGYGLDGCLKAVPYKDQFVGLDETRLGLVPVEVELFLGFIFIRIKGDGPSVADQFVPALEDLAPYRFEELQPLGRVTMRPRQVNWKQVADNYVDALHIPVAHPGLTSLMGNSYGLEVVGGLHKMWGDVRTIRGQGPSVRMYREILPDMDHLPDSKKHHWLYYRMWPALAFDIYPEQVDFMQFIPISATETMIREIPYGLPDDRREVKAARYLNWRINREVNREDTELIIRVQEGMQSSAFTSGPLAKTETCLLDSARQMRDALPVASSRLEPAGPYEKDG